MDAILNYSMHPYFPSKCISFSYFIQCPLVYYKPLFLQVSIKKASQRHIQEMKQVTKSTKDLSDESENSIQKAIFLKALKYNQITNNCTYFEYIKITQFIVVKRSYCTSMLPTILHVISITRFITHRNSIYFCDRHQRISMLLMTLNRNLY